MKAVNKRDPLEFKTKCEYVCQQWNLRSIVYVHSILLQVCHDSFMIFLECQKGEKVRELNVQSFRNPSRYTEMPGVGGKVHRLHNPGKHRFQTYNIPNTRISFGVFVVEA